MAPLGSLALLRGGGLVTAGLASLLVEPLALLPALLAALLRLYALDTGVLHFGAGAGAEGADAGAGAGVGALRPLRATCLGTRCGLDFVGLVVSRDFEAGCAFDGRAAWYCSNVISDTFCAGLDGPSRPESGGPDGVFPETPSSP